MKSYNNIEELSPNVSLHKTKYHVQIFQQQSITFTDGVVNRLPLHLLIQNVYNIYNSNKEILSRLWLQILSKFIFQCFENSENIPNYLQELFERR